MTGRGIARPATTSEGRESSASVPSHSVNQATGGPRFEGIERMFGKAGNLSSDAAETPVRHGRSRRQVRKIPRLVMLWSWDGGRGGWCGRRGT